jgi:hypothetical protein
LPWGRPFVRLISGCARLFRTWAQR